MMWGGEIKPHFFSWCYFMTANYSLIPRTSLPEMNLCDCFNQLIWMHVLHMGLILVFHRTLHTERKQERGQNNTVTCEHTDQAVWLIEKCVTILPQPGPPPLSDHLLFIVVSFIPVASVSAISAIWNRLTHLVRRHNLFSPLWLLTNMCTELFLILNKSTVCPQLDFFG